MLVDLTTKSMETLMKFLVIKITSMAVSTKSMVTTTNSTETKIKYLEIKILSMEMAVLLKAPKTTSMATTTCC